MFERKKYVLEVYREKSFSKAAGKLYISQPSLSATVKKEEEELGTPIFDRSVNPIRLTETGEAYIRVASGIEDLELQFASYMEDRRNLKTGSITIGGSNLFVSYILPPLISEYMASFPALTVTLREEDSAHLTGRLLADELDLVMDNSLLDPTLFEQILFCHEYLLLTVPEETAVRCGAMRYAMTAEDIRAGRHLSPAAEALPLALFAGESFLLLNEGNDTRGRADSLLQHAGVHPRTRLLLDQQITAYKLSDSGMGISFTGDLLIKKLPPSHTLRFFKLEGTEVERNVFFYRRRKRFETKAVRAFLKLAGEHEI